MIKELLLKQLGLELKAASQMAFVAGFTKDPSLRKAFLKFAKDELEHFTKVTEILIKMGHTARLVPLEIPLEQDELKALILLDAMKDTMIHYYEEILTELKEPLRAQIKKQLIEERDHRVTMKELLDKAKKGKE